MKKFLLTITWISMLVPILVGCWNQEELTNLAFVMAVGIDKANDNKGYQLTFEIVNPGNVASTQMGGGQGSPVAVYKSKGKTLLEASRNASKELSRRLYYAHTSAVVISEQVAKEGILDLLDLFDRDPVFRTTTQLAVAKNGSAENVVSTLTILDKIPVNKIVKSLEVTENMLGENTKITIDDFISSIVSTGKEPFMNGVVLPGDKSKGKKMSNIASDMPDVIIKTNGLAIFKGGKLIGWVDGKNARGLMWVMNKVKSTNVMVDWQGKSNAAGLIIRRTKTKVSVDMESGKPVFKIRIKAEGDIDQANARIDLSNTKVISELEGKSNQEIEKEVRASIKSIQRKKSDIVGFGEKVHRADPKYWKRVEQNWDEVFSTVEVRVKLDTYIRRNGIRTKPFWVDLK